MTLSSQTGSRLAVVLTEARPAPFPISIDPSMGTIEPGQMQNFNIHFSPVEVAQYQCRLVCRYSNEEFCCEKKIGSQFYNGEKFESFEGVIQFVLLLPLLLVVVVVILLRQASFYSC